MGASRGGRFCHFRPSTTSTAAGSPGTTPLSGLLRPGRALNHRQQRKRMPPEAVDALFDNRPPRPTRSRAPKPPLKSLSYMFERQQGRSSPPLRPAVKRVDYSRERSVIVVGPHLLKLTPSAALPKLMALSCSAVRHENLVARSWPRTSSPPSERTTPPPPGCGMGVACSMTSSGAPFAPHRAPRCTASHPCLRCRC